ncbi:MAG: AAA family ATPase [Pseudomonadota bacterium]
MAERIMIIGSPGSGKSTLARELAARESLPLFHLDQLHWNAGWVEPDKAEWRQRVIALAAQPRWIIDGNYSSTQDVGLARADRVILLDLSPFRCTWRVLKRVLAARGTTRPDMAPDCPERFSLSFLWYVLTFRIRALPRALAKLEAYDGELVWLGTPREISAFLNSKERFDQDAHE